MDPSGHDCELKEQAINRLKAVGLSEEQSRVLYAELRKNNSITGTLNKISETLEEMEKRCGKDIFEGTDAQIGDMQITRAEYELLRAKTPSKKIQTLVNMNIEELLGTEDFALPGLKIDGTLQADHIVSMQTIARMDGFAKLTFDQKLRILNDEFNFKGLSESANKSKGAKTYFSWQIYKKLDMEINKSFRDSMIIQEKVLQRYIQTQIDSLAGG